MSEITVCIIPRFDGRDNADGGIRRVVEAQQRYLPEYGIRCTYNPDEADILGLHAGNWLNTSKPTVAHCHGLYWEGYDWERWALELNHDVIRTLKQADAITAPSEWVAQALRRGMWCEPVVLYHGIEPSEWVYGESSPDSYVLWNKGRVDAICDPEPVDHLARVFPQIKFATTFGPKLHNVEVTGPIPYDNAKTYVQRAAVYLATTRETFGIGTLEAMACGVPVLGWNWGGQREIIRHRETGYLADPGDYDSLIEGLRFCLAEHKRLGEAARADVLRRFTWKDRIKPYADLYWALHREAVTPKPRVSVVITNYNLGKFLPEAVASAEARDTEIIVVDDASTEPLPDLPDSVRVIRNEKNLYLAGALNVGIRAARGRYVLPLDADNMLAPGAVGLLADALDADRDLDIAYGRMGVLRDDGSSFVSDWPPRQAQVQEQLKHRNQISSTAMYRKRVWERVLGYRRRCHTAEDADFWCRALMTGAVGRQVTEAVTLIYRDRQESMSHVQKDWDWHRWYASTPPLFSTGGAIPAYEFPKISVVIPVGPGHSEIVIDALDSVHAQSFKYWEAIVVNDSGCTVRVPSWARVLCTGGKRGAAHARNLGIKESHSPYVLFLDADDYLTPDALRFMYDAIVENQGFVYGDWYVAETGEYKDAPDYDCNAVLTQLPYPVTCMYSKRDLLSRGIMFDPDFASGWEDWDFALQVVAKHGLCGTHITAPTFHYRLGSGTLREKAYASKDELLKDVRAKWAGYISGKEPNMGCGGCGGARTMPSILLEQAMRGTNTREVPMEPQTLLRYTQDNQNPRTFVGQVTNRRYKFASEPGFQEQLVDSRDVPWFIQLGMFEVVEGAQAAAEPLKAPGPPAKAMPTQPAPRSVDKK